MNKKLQILSFILVGFSQFAFGQIKEEKLILDRKREPEVKRIEKKKTSIPAEKNYPPKEKKTQDSLNLKYNITDVPAVSDFKPSTIQGSDISPNFTNDYQNNYFQIGYGNYGRILADANISTVLESKMELGADVHYNSTEGLKKKYAWDSKQNTANFGAFLNSYGEQGKFNINADYTSSNYNYYGIYAMSPQEKLDIGQSVGEFKVNGYYDFYSNNILNDIRVKSSFLKDDFDAKESSAEIQLNLAKHAVDVYTDVVMNADLGVGIQTQSTEFDLLNKNSSKYLNLGLSPKVTFFKGDSYLMLGSNFSFLSGENNNTYIVDAIKANKTYWFPKAEALLAATDEFKFYIGVDGGLKLNSYSSLLQENPFLVSNQYLKPTETKYNVYFGLKGDISQDLKYNVSAGFAKMHDIMFFKANDLFNRDISSLRSGWDYANTFSAAYDNGTLSEVKGSVQYFPLQNLVIDGELKFQKYKLDNNNDIYNVPLIRAEIGAKYTMLQKKLMLGFKGFFVSDKTSNSFGYTEALPVYISNENTDTKVGGYADLNLSAEYKFHKNFSIFVNGNNLLNANYQTFNGYKVLGAQILGGVKITF